MKSPSTTTRLHAGLRMFALLAGLLLTAAAPSACGATRAPAASAGAAVSVDPLTGPQLTAIEKVQERVEAMLVVEVMRPAGIEPDGRTLDEMRQRLRVGLMLVDLVGGVPEQHYEVARTLGTIYATGTSLGWPGAAQLSEYFLQLALERRPDGAEALEALGMLHLLTGDVSGATHYLEAARASEPASPSVTLALGQAYHLAGRQEEAEATVGELIEANPDSRLPRHVLDLLRMADAVDGPVFRAPASLQAEPFRPASTMSFLQMPLHVEYRNVAHGFALQVPWNWTLHEEETDLEIDSECSRLAFASWDLPLDVRAETEGLSRVRVIAFPLSDGMTVETLLADPPFFVQLPSALTPVESSLEGATRGHWEDATRSGRQRLGDVVFTTQGAMGFVLQYVATPEAYERGRAAFDELVEGFRALQPGRWAPPGCLDQQPI